MPASALSLEQSPAPFTQIVRHAGQTLRVTLAISAARAGRAFLRCNLGRAAIHRRETVDFYEQGRPRLGRDWGDLPMRQTDDTHFEIVLPLCETGIFEFKAFFQEEEPTPRSWWPRGENAKVKVEPATAFAGNTIYNAFVRQFGDALERSHVTPEQEAAAKLLDEAHYTVIPPSGHFRDLRRHLDLIQNELGFRILQFLPVHPAPTTFARMGRFGSPVAPLDFFAVDSALADFDRRTTPLEQFLELIDQIHGRGGLVFLDLPIDHTGWGSTLQSQHPEWFARNPDGTFQSPGAWGVVWADLCKLDFSHRGLWRTLAEVFLHWCRNGVDGFRCDAGYMIPADAWEYIIARVRQEYPDTIFFLEGLGGGIDATTRLLSESGMDWAYSELFQNYSAQEISGYLNFANGYSATKGALVHFAETHDNDRLAAKGPAWARLRVALAALFSPAGCFGIANGVEWLATAKIDVHGAAPLNWGAQNNLVAFLARLNQLLQNHPAFQADAAVRVPYGAAGKGVGMLRIPAQDAEHTLLIVANPELHTPGTFEWNMEEFDADTPPVDLLTGRRIPVRYLQCQIQVPLKPAEVLILARPDADGKAPSLPRRQTTSVQRQMLRATVLSFLVARQGYGDVGQIQLDALAAALHRTPLEFLRKLNGDGYLPVVEWYPEHDERRLLLLPPGHHLLLHHRERFIASLSRNGKCLQKIEALPREDGRYFALFQPVPRITRPTDATLALSVFSRDSGEVHRLQAPVRLLPPSDRAQVTPAVSRDRLSPRQVGLATTALGAYGLLRAAWGAIDSQYDAMLALNQHPGMPVDKTVALVRCRVWLIHRDFSQEIGPNCQTAFEVAAPNTMRWSFIVPTGMGGNAYFSILYVLDRQTGRMTLRLTRCIPPGETEEEADAMHADSPVTLLVRPDLDDRSFHANTSAARRDRVFPARVTPRADGFEFTLDSGNRLALAASRGAFIAAQEWNCAIHHRLEAERGLPAQGDLFSPGFFKCTLLRGESLAIEASLLPPEDAAPPAPADASPVPAFPAAPRRLPFTDALREALDAFVVRRGDLKTVIAGYPWFLDWGRDTLLCLPGLLAAGRHEDTLAILRQFASFEQDGTLPNMINGQDAANRDTTDAPLLLFHAVRAYLRERGEQHAAALLDLPCGGRTLRQVLVSIAEHYLAGTPNGIRVDAASGLVYSPPHFTWMDTNYPACTPREGYPVEIQALWHSALAFLAQHADTPDAKYARLARLVQQSVNRLYPSGKFIGLTDCLHATSGQPAAEAVADDACRPNQLLAITLGVVTDQTLRRQILRACSALVVPGAIRSLADQPMQFAMPIRGAGGRLLNNPERPYWGHYEGDEDTRRKPAYHNGTAWGLPFPAYCEALFLTYGESARAAAAALLASASTLMEQCCLGQLPEIVDGDLPHTPRGCCAQAWSVAEAYRVHQLLANPPQP